MLQNVVERSQVERDHTHSLFLNDQFEELFTLCHNEEEQVALILFLVIQYLSYQNMIVPYLTIILFDDFQASPFNPLSDLLIH